MVRIRVIQTLQIPTPILRKPTDRIHPLGHQPPQLLRRTSPTRIPTPNTHNRHRLLGTSENPGRARGALLDPLGLGAQIVGDRGWGGVVEDQGGGEA